MGDAHGELLLPHREGLARDELLSASLGCHSREIAGSRHRGAGTEAGTRAQSSRGEGFDGLNQVVAGQQLQRVPEPPGSSLPPSASFLGLTPISCKCLSGNLRGGRNGLSKSQQ